MVLDYTTDLLQLELSHGTNKKAESVRNAAQGFCFVALRVSLPAKRSNLTAWFTVKIHLLVWCDNKTLQQPQAVHVAAGVW